MPRGGGRARRRGAGRLSEHAVAAQTIAGTTITVEYYRPVARGRDSLFGKVVTWGEHWTPGANWATTVEVDHDVRVNGAACRREVRALDRGAAGRWSVELHRTWRKFHVPPPADSTDEQLRLHVTPERGPPTEVLTFDFPEVRPAATTLRFRWGTVVVSLLIAAIPPPLALLASRRDATPYLGRYDSRILRGDSTSRGGAPGELVRAGDTLRWRDAGGPAAERRDFVLAPPARARVRPRAGPRTGSTGRSPAPS